MKMYLFKSFHFIVQIIITIAMKILSFWSMTTCSFHKREEVSEISRPELILLFSEYKESRNI